MIVYKPEPPLLPFFFLLLIPHANSLLLPHMCSARFSQVMAAPIRQHTGPSSDGQMIFVFQVIDASLFKFPQFLRF
ncbi:hypothetical protein LY78DRAFT_49956 [Colletotrichum sublineola]|nr:hypothetical protein LY78DRAFT_49956 [Colletotrichum sublineola]